MKRRDFMVLAGGIALKTGGGLIQPWRLAAASAKADHTIRIAPVSVDLAPGRTISTIGYNGTVPGPVLRMKEGKPVTIDVFNDTDVPELLHCTGCLSPPRWMEPRKKEARSFRLTVTAGSCLRPSRRARAGTTLTIWR